jgi:hypothetical protein
MMNYLQYLCNIAGTIDFVNINKSLRISRGKYGERMQVGGHLLLKYLQAAHLGEDILYNLETKIVEILEILTKSQKILCESLLNSLLYVLANGYEDFIFKNCVTEGKLPVNEYHT